MNKIIPYHDNSRNCIEDQVVSITKWFGRDFELMFTLSWGFNFFFGSKYEKLLLGEKIGPGFYDVLKPLNEFHGINSNTYNNISVQDALKILKDEFLKLKPVVVFFDSFYCPWEHNYKKTHFFHAFIINGMEEKSGNDEKNKNVKIFSCIDAFRMKPSEKLNFSDFNAGFQNVLITFDIIENFSLNKNYQDIIRLILKNLNYDSDHSIFKFMRLFAGEVSKSLDIKKELQASDQIWFSPLIFNMEKIIRSRIQFQTALSYMAKLFSINNFEKVSRFFQLIYNQWNILKNLIIKEYYRDSDYKDKNVLKRISDRILNIADMEESSVAYFKEIADHGESKEVFINELGDNKNIKRSYFNQIIFIDLTLHMNNKAFCYPQSNMEYAQFNEMGDVLLPEGLPENKIWEINSMKFIFPKPDIKNKDNILCKNQLINIPAKKYNTIMFLGCSESGNFSEKLLLNFEDKTIEEIKLSLSDFYEEKPFYNEKIARKVTWHNKRINVTYTSKSNIYAVSYPIQNFEKQLINIRLPDCMNMHLFAISLGYNE